MASFHADFIPRSPKILLHRSSFLPLKNRKALTMHIYTYIYTHTHTRRKPCSSIEAAKAGEE